MVQYMQSTNYSIHIVEYAFIVMDQFHTKISHLQLQHEKLKLEFD